MFLSALSTRNEPFLRAVMKLYAEGKLEANTYVIDLETVRGNAAAIAGLARSHGLNVYAMTKQMGYHPAFHQAVRDGGIDSFVAVDWAGARRIHRQGFKLGHVGHLVQAPNGVVAELAAMRPEVFTVFTLQKAGQLQEAARQLNVRQNILLRVYGDRQLFYPGHEGGFPVSSVVDAAREIMKLPNLNIVGVTSFPCLLFDEQSRDVRPTVNFDAVTEAARLLEKELGIAIRQVNVPGTNSSALFEMIAAKGGTHVEPGHGLTGTTPLATVSETAEKPAVLYLSEISHLHAGRGHVFGGGLYVDPVRGSYPIQALVGEDLRTRAAELIPAGGIDYYGYIDGQVREGEPVIFGFRPQVFVTRAHVAAVDGIGAGDPFVVGRCDSQGNPL